MLRRLSILIFSYLTIGLGLDVSAEPLVSQHQNLEVSIDDDAREITIRTIDGSAFSAESFDLNSPRRLVIDIRSQITQRNRLVRVKSKLFSSLRFGAHSDRTRVVFDLNGRDLPSYNVVQEGLRLKITLDTSAQAEVMATPRAVSSSEQSVVPTSNTATSEIPVVIQTTSANPVAPPSEEATLPNPTLTPTSLPTELPTAAATFTAPTATSIPDVTQTQSATNTQVALTATQVPEAPARPEAVTSSAPSVAPTELPTAIASPDQTSTIVGAAASQGIDPNAAPVVTAIIFEREGQLQSPIIRIKLNRRSEFKVSRLYDKFYKISIPAVRLDRAGLGLPQFPPQDFEGFSLVTAKDEARGIEIRVGVERNSRVTVVPAETDILVRIAK